MKFQNNKNRNLFKLRKNMLINTKKIPSRFKIQKIRSKEHLKNHYHKLSRLLKKKKNKIKINKIKKRKNLIIPMMPTL
jgi:hypothetical protein